jgi:putative hemolysin
MSVTSLRPPISASPFVRSDEDRQNAGSGLVDVHALYRVRLASSEADRTAAFRLRFMVFNLELNEGLDTAHATGYDTDQSDAGL